MKAWRSAIKDVPRVIREALFSWTRGQSFGPSAEWDEAVERAQENDMLTLDRDGTYGFWPNEERPKVKRAMETISALRQFLEQDRSKEFYDEATNKFGDTPDIKRRSFWDEQLR